MKWSRHRRYTHIGAIGPMRRNVRSAFLPHSFRRWLHASIRLLESDSNRIYEWELGKLSTDVSIKGSEEFIHLHDVFAQKFAHENQRNQGWENDKHRKVQSVGPALRNRAKPYTFIGQLNSSFLWILCSCTSMNRFASHYYHFKIVLILRRTKHEDWISFYKIAYMFHARSVAIERMGN